MNEIPHDFIADCAEAEIKLEATMDKLRQAIKKVKPVFREISIKEFLDNNTHCIFNGYIAQDENGFWFWSKTRPNSELDRRCWKTDTPDWSILEAFNIRMESDWTKTLYEIKDGEWRKVDE